MADNDVVITVKSRDRSDPNKVRQRWRATGQQIERDSKESGERSGKGWLKGFGDGADNDAVGSALKKVLGSYTSAFTLSAKTAATAFSAQFISSVVAGLASGAAKVAHGAGSLLALLPAIAVTGVAAMGTLRLAVAGVGDAMEAAVTGDAKDFDEAIKGLSPSARSFAREVRGMRKDLIGFRDVIQERFFSQFEGQASKLAKTWLPILRRELGGISAGFGAGASAFATWARQPKVVLQLTAALHNARAALAPMGRIVTNLAQAFLPLITVGSSFLPRFTSGLGDATAKFALFMQHAADTGKLERFIQGGLDKLKSLGETAQQLWRIGGNIVDIFAQFGSVGGGVFAALGLESGGLLDSLELLTVKAKAFFETSAGGQAMTEIFGILRSLLSATFGTLAHLVPILARSFAPVLKELSEFAEAIVNLQFAMADALEPALQAFAGILKTILPPLTAVLNMIADSGPAAAALAGEILGLYAAYKLFGAAQAVAKANLSGAKIGMAGAASAAAGLALALINIDAERHAKQIDENTQRYIAMDGAVNGSTKALIYISQITGTLNEQFASIAAASPRHAQAIIDNAEAYGLTAEEAAALQEQLDVTTAATDNLTDAFTRQRDAMRAATDPFFAVIDAQERLEEAQRNALATEKDKNATAAEKLAADQEAVQAALDLEAAVLDLSTAHGENNNIQKDAIGHLKRLRDSGQITEEQFRQMALMVAATSGEIRAVPPEANTQVNAHTRTALNNIGQVAGALTRLNGRSAFVSIFTNIGSSLVQLLAQNFAHGGITGAAAGGPRSRRTWVGEHGPELVDLPPGSHVHSNADSMSMATAGGPVVIEWVGRPSDSLGRAIFDWFRDNIRVNYGGDVDRGLGA